MSTPSCTRFAPSPTGSLHIGGVRTALYCLLWARHTGGRFLLRIEDTDQVRSSEAASRGIVEDMRWLGLNWDEGPEIGGPSGPYFQSERLEIYDRYVEQLLSEGKAYQAWETREELTALRLQAELDKQTYRYHRQSYSADDLARFEAEGRKPVVRLAAPTHAVTVHDAILGDVTLETSDLDDIVIRKDDGFPTYHFAVVIDDHLMGVDLILRGQEHLMNTHKHFGAFEALGWEPITTGHLPLIFSPRGSKMSKRDKAKTARQAAREASKGRAPGWFWLADLTRHGAGELELFMSKKTDDLQMAIDIADALHVDLPMIEVLDFRKAGYLPEALLNYLALLGWSPGDDRELLTMDELVEAFDVARIGKTPARFDPDKLKWMNAEYLRNRLDIDRIVACFAAWFAVVDSPLAALERDRLVALFEMYKPRIHTLLELEEASGFLFTAPEAYDPAAVEKHLLKGDGVHRLLELLATLRDVGRWELESLERAMNTLCEQTGGKLGKFAQPLRIALSGTAVTPSIYDVLVFLGRDETLDRIAACLEHFSAHD